jgi:hypothetical protein
MRISDPTGEHQAAKTMAASAAAPPPPPLPRSEPLVATKVQTSASPAGGEHTWAVTGNVEGNIQVEALARGDGQPLSTYVDLHGATISSSHANGQEQRERAKTEARQVKQEKKEQKELARTEAKRKKRELRAKAKAEAEERQQQQREEKANSRERRRLEAERAKARGLLP